jgi:hypothetical protein
MEKIDFLDRAMAGKSPQAKAAAIQILDLYLSSPVWRRDDTSSDRRAGLRRILEDMAVSGNKSIRK